MTTFLAVWLGLSCISFFFIYLHFLYVPDSHQRFFPLSIWQTILITGIFFKFNFYDFINTVLQKQSEFMEYFWIGQGKLHICRGQEEIRGFSNREWGIICPGENRPTPSKLIVCISGIVLFYHVSQGMMRERASWFRISSI